MAAALSEWRARYKAGMTLPTFTFRPLADGARLGQGLGRAMVRAFVAHLFEDAAVTVVQTDPSPDNPRAIRCYAAAGFEPAGEVLTPDGPARLMRCRR